MITVASTGISGAVAVTLAWRGFGVWSLVLQQVTQSLVRGGLLWTLSCWRPKWMFSVAALAEMFKFGWGMLCSGLLGSVFENLYPLLIGKFFSASSLGYFNRAQSLQSVASQGLAGIANRVTFPVFSSLQDDLARFRRMLRKAMTTIVFVQFPMMVGLAVVAKPLILLLFAEKWAASIPCLQLLALAGLLYPIHLLNLNVVIALGRSDLFLRLQVAKLLIFVVIGVTTFRWGMMAMIWGMIVCDTLCYFLNSYYTKKLIGYSAWDQMLDLYPYLIASGVMGLVVALVGSCLPPGNFLQLSFRIIFGVFVYYCICRSMRAEALNELVSMISRKAASATPLGSC